VSTKLFLGLLAQLLVALLPTLARLLCLLAGFLLGPALLATVLTTLVLLAALIRIVHWNTSRVERSTPVERYKFHQSSRLAGATS
jgi:hypothetical protein